MAMIVVATAIVQAGCERYKTNIFNKAAAERELRIGRLMRPYKRFRWFGKTKQRTLEEATLLVNINDAYDEDNWLEQRMLQDQSNRADRLIEMCRLTHSDYITLTEDERWVLPHLTNYIPKRE